MSSLTDFFGGSGIDQSAIALDATAIALGIDRTRLTYWVQGETVTSAESVRVFNKIAYYAPQAALSNPILCDETPLDEPSVWYTFTINANAQQEIILGAGETVLEFDGLDCRNAAFYIDGDYVDSGRLGADRFTVQDQTHITLAESYPAGTTILGLSNINDAPGTSINTKEESITLSTGQTDVTFVSILSAYSSFYISGPLVDSGRLVGGTDYDIASSRGITLRESYPAGTTLLGIFNDTGILSPEDVSDKTVTTASGNSKALSDWMDSVDTIATPNEIVVTATGSNTARQLQERFADVVNVKDFGAVGDGATDDTAAIQAAIDSGGERSTVILPKGTYKVTEALVLDNSFQTLQGFGAATIDSSEFNVGVHKGVIESLTRKNGVNLRGSREFIIIDGINIEGSSVSSKQINGFALSGFTRGCELKNCRVRYHYNGIAISGSWSSTIKNNLLQNNTNCNLLLGDDILMTTDGIGGHTDGGSNPILPQEGYEYTSGSISVQCNAMEIIHNTCNGTTSSKHNFSMHFGNAVAIKHNTFESCTDVGVKITALESGTFNTNYMEGNEGIIFGRNSSGIVQDITCTGNFLNDINIYWLGFQSSVFKNNEYVGTINDYRGAFQRNHLNETDRPNTAFGTTDTGVMRSSYTYGRDNNINRDASAKVAHQGLFQSNFQNCQLETGLKLTDQNDIGNSMGAITQQVPFRDETSIAKQKVTTTPVTISAITISGMYIVSGSDESNNTTRFVDIVLAIGFGTTSVVSSVTRGTAPARTYSMSGANLQLSLSTGTYDVGVRGFHDTNQDVEPS